MLASIGRIDVSASTVD